MVGMFGVMLFMIFVQMERHQKGPAAPALDVVSPALYVTLGVMGAMICGILIALRLTKRPPR
jgi:Mn2+/Fe2+ NRAMP family transporter